MKLSIIIPTYNEEVTIEKILRQVHVATLPKGVSKEIIVVDDGSTDNSLLKIRNLRIKGIKVISHKKNLGKGAAIKTAMKHATGDLIIIQDADLEYNPKYYHDLLQPILKKDAKIVFGSRLINYPLKLWGRDKTVLPIHLIANIFLTKLTNLLYGSGLTDMETGYKLFRKEVLQEMVLAADGFDFEAEVTAKSLKKQIPIIEIPIMVKPRTYSEGKKIGWQDGVSAIWTLIKYRF